MTWEACISTWFFVDAKGFGRIQILPSVIVPWNKMKNASDSWDHGLRTCSSGFSLKVNGHRVIAVGVRGKRIWEDWKITVSYCPLKYNETYIRKLRSRATHLQFRFFDQIKRPWSNCQWCERLVFLPDFLTMQEVLGGLKYHHQLFSPEIKWKPHPIAKIKGYAPAVRVFQSN